MTANLTALITLATNARDAAQQADERTGDYLAAAEHAAMYTEELLTALRDLALPTSPVWPQNDTERATYTDWQAEVANGDTAIGFRDWTNRPAEELVSEDEQDD